jgi:CspA family cold shock protein
VPTGKVRFFDADKGFGFIAEDEGADVFLHANALPEGVTTLKKGTRVEFGIVEGRKGAQALQVRVLDPVASVATNKRERERLKPDDLVIVIEDLLQVLDELSDGLRKGRYPDKAFGKKVGDGLRKVAEQIEG